MNKFRRTASRIFLLVQVTLFFCILVTLCASHSFGASFMELRKAAIEGGQYVGTNREPFLNMDNEYERLQHTTNMLMDIDLACTSFNEICLFWNNAVESKATDRQYRMISWKYRFGLSLGEHFELGWNHLSSHMLDDEAHMHPRFPLENIIYIQFKFVDSPRRYGGW